MPVKSERNRRKRHEFNSSITAPSVGRSWSGPPSPPCFRSRACTGSSQANRWTGIRPGHLRPPMVGGTDLARYWEMAQLARTGPGAPADRHTVGYTESSFLGDHVRPDQFQRSGSWAAPIAKWYTKP